MRKKEVIARLSEIPEDNLVWQVIEEVLEENEELIKLERFAALDIDRGIDCCTQAYYSRLRELEQRLGV